MPETTPNPNTARRRWIAACAVVSAVLALAAGFYSVFNVGLLPPKLEKRQLAGGAAILHATLVLPRADRPASHTDFETEAKRLNLIGNLMGSRLLLKRIGRLDGVDPEQIAATTQINESAPVAFVEPANEHNANLILASKDPYRLDIQARPVVPVLDIYTQAPSPAQAASLGEAAIKASNHYLQELAREDHVRGSGPTRLVQIGTTNAGTVDSGAALKVAGLTVVVVFAISFGLLFLAGEIRRGWLRAGNSAEGRADPPETPIDTTPRRDDWPHTSRLLPWMIAGFLVMIWLIPINAIVLQVSLPVELTLDRLALPLIVLAWLFTRATGGPDTPRWKFTVVHGAIAAFVAVAFLSVVLNAAHLGQDLELELAIKKLTLLAAFFTLFLIVASSIRLREVRAFMTLTLVLAVICGVGVIWEFQFESNLFYTWSAQIFPSIFHVTAANSSGFDEIGRRAVLGPAESSLEVVAMLTMALPISLARVMYSSRARDRFLYGLAACVLMGAMISTYRKSALLAPISVCLIMAYFQRGRLLKLAPLGVVILVAIPVLAPNALGAIVDQFNPNRLEATTVSDRVSDYDAIRPDLYSHPLFGRGFGSYDHITHRILDNDLLSRVVETGLVGLVAFVLMLVLSMAAAAPIIRGRDPNLASAALAVAAAAGAFLVLAVLFDIMSFPHTPYILMTLLGFLAVIVGAVRESRERVPTPRRSSDPRGDAPLTEPTTASAAIPLTLQSD